MKLVELVPWQQVSDGLRGGVLDVSFHPTLPLWVGRRVKEAAWNEATSIFHGLIVNGETNEVICRPWAKFFDHDSPLAPTIEDDSPVEVSEKIDGVFGVLYPNPNYPTGYAIATPGSFDGVVASKASELFQKSAGEFKPRQGFTYLFEIVSDCCRKIIDYGHDENVYLIGIVNTTTGDLVSVRHPHVSVPRAPADYYSSYAAGLKKLPTYGEGVVVRDLTNNNLVSIRTEYYINKRGKGVPPN